KENKTTAVNYEFYKDKMPDTSFEEKKKQSFSS
ncbi:hypothetical protein AVEN_132371-2-1, partial [Araneus ventricosus]